MAQNTKTPAMVLQEFTVQQSFAPPEYILEHSKTGTHENEFHYRVEVAHIVAKGFGRSKQVAKHAAANNALKVLAERGLFDLNKNPMQGFNVQSHRNEPNSPHQPLVNFVGTLTDKCTDQKLPYPIYTEVSDVGPPHCRMFTYECKINAIKTQATANTKKQAKQLAAKEMLDKVRYICPDLTEPPSNALTENEEKIIKTYYELSGDDVIPNRAIEVRNFPKTIRNLMDFKGLNFDNFLEDFQQKNKESFEKIMNQLELKYQLHVVQENPSTMLSLTILLETPFTLMALGNSYDEAEINLISETFSVLDVYMNISLS